MSQGRVVVLRRFNAARDMVAKPFATPKAQWVVGVLQVGSAWAESCWASLEHAAKAAELLEVPFEARLRRRKGERKGVRP